MHACSKRTFFLNVFALNPPFRVLFYFLFFLGKGVPQARQDVEKELERLKNMKK